MITRLLSALALLLIVSACNNETISGTKERAANSQTPIQKDDNIAIQAPRTAEPAPPPPPPPPPPPAVIEEVPEEALEIEEVEVEWNPDKPRYTEAEEMRMDEYSRAYEATPMPSEPYAENYSPIVENDYHSALSNPFSTFSIDVDKAAYSNMRRFLNQGQLPPVDAVRIEELINYFDYDYPQPKGEVPFSVSTEVASCPWNENHQLVHIGLKGRELPKENLPPSNLVFLLDVSGSMGQANKLPLLKNAFKMLVNQLRATDRVAIVVYAGASGLVLSPTPGSNKTKILQALNQLSSGGSTAGGQGIQLAYQVARRHFVKGGNNRVILATDGDFNVGLSRTDELVKLIEQERQDGIYLSVLGFGTGNYKDAQMEQLADHGNGNYAYIDQLSEARKVLVNEFASTLFTIAKDVKIQVEFNPLQVKAYRLLGYENRLLKDEDFNDDQKDAGEIGAGHSVTALYEIVLAGGEEVPSAKAKVDALKYQERKLRESAELMTVKLRYKPLHQEESRKIEVPVVLQEEVGEIERITSENFRFATAVAGFGLLLRNSKYKGSVNYRSLHHLAKSATGDDPHGYRHEFLQLIELAESYDTRWTASQ